MAKLLKDVEVNSIVKINENGVPVEFYVACHDYEAELNGTGRTLLVRKDGHSIVKWDAGNVNEYDGSDIDLWLNNDYFSCLDEAIQRKIGETEIHYAKGKQVNTAATLRRKAFLLSVTEFAMSYSYATPVGTALPTASNLKIAYVDGTAVNQWTRSSYTTNATYACLLNTTGKVVANDAKIELYYARPAFTLPAEDSVILDDDTVVFDMPTISGEDADLGAKPKNFTIDYVVTESLESGATITVTEMVNDTIIRTYTTASGVSQTMTVSVVKLPDTNHTAVIVAEINGLSAERKYTFNVPSFNLQDGGTIQEFQDENSEPIFPATLARAVITTDGKSVERGLMDLVEGLNGVSELVENSTKIVIGSYVGIGSSDSMTLAINGIPKIVIIMGETYWLSDTSNSIFWAGQAKDSINGSYRNYTVTSDLFTVAATKNSNGGYYASAMNSANTTYHYILFY